jgi:lysophospholipase L1-like esterase
MKMRPAPPTTKGVIRALGVLSVLAIVSAPPVAAAEPPKFNPPKAYYLALGDSFAYGFTNAKYLAGLPPSAFDTGFVDVFAQQLRTIQPSIRVVNYACVGESTRTFMTGPCLGNTLGIGLHDDWSGTQLDAALAFLSMHKGEVSPITITLWANDVRELAESCNQDFACILDGAPATITRVATNLKTILTRLRSAAPQAEIIVTGPWNSAVGTFPITDPLYLQLDGAIKHATMDTRVRFADLFPVFNPQGDVDAEAVVICALTLVCLDGDIHLSDAGNRVVADGLWETSRYQRLVA